MFFSEHQASRANSRGRERPVGMSPVFNREAGNPNIMGPNITRSTIPLSDITKSTLGSNTSAPESFYSAISGQEDSDEDYSIQAPRGFRVRNRLGESSTWTMSPASLGSPFSSIPETPELIYQNTGRGLIMQARASDNMMRSSNDSNGTFGSSSSYNVTRSDYEQIVSQLEAEETAKKNILTGNRNPSIRRDATFTISSGNSSVISGTPFSGQAMNILKKRGFAASMTHRGNSLGTSNSEDHGSLDISMTTPVFPMFPRIRTDSGLFLGPPGYTPAPRPLPRTLFPLAMGQADEDKENQDPAKLERPKTLAIESKGVRFKETDV